MKRVLAALILILAAGMAQGQAAHGIQWTWAAPTSGATPASYNLYQAAGACPASGLPTGAIQIAGTVVASYQQTPLPSGVTCTYVTAVSAVGVEGPPSNTFQFDTTPPGAPTGLSGKKY